jgi:hypothetical protein
LRPPHNATSDVFDASSPGIAFSVCARISVVLHFERVEHAFPEKQVRSLALVHLDRLAHLLLLLRTRRETANNRRGSFECYAGCPIWISVAAVCERIGAVFHNLLAFSRSVDSLRRPLMRLVALLLRRPQLPAQINNENDCFGVRPDAVVAQRLLMATSRFFQRVALLLELVFQARRIEGAIPDL